MKYLVKKYYRGKDGPHRAGEVVDLDERTAKLINADEPGTLEPVKRKRRKRAPKKPEQDRMVHGDEAETRQETVFAATKSGKQY